MLDLIYMITKVFKGLILLCVMGSYSAIGVERLENATTLSPRCKNMLEKHKQRVHLKQRLKALISRNSRLQKITPLERKELREVLRENMVRLSHKLEYIVTKAEREEEQMIRQGCPSISI